MEKIYDCLIVGAGVVGASIFNKLVQVGKSCLMIDCASDVATGASKANSGLIHAGYDPLPNTLKAKLNVRGNKMYPEICQRLGVPLKKTGALVVGDDEEKIQTLYARGKENGVRVEILNRKQIVEKVPEIAEHITVALFAPDAYIINPYLLTITLTEEGIINGGEVLLEEDLVSAKRVGDIFEVKTKKHTFKTKNVVNSAGTGYNVVSKIFGGEEYKLQFRRGEYFVFDKLANIKVPCTVFPLPTKLGKGVLVTPTVDGNFLVGPTSEENSGTTETTFTGLKEIKEKSSNMIGNLNFRQAIREFAGVRTICGDDFIIEKSKKQQGLINLAGICSPGLSSAPAIAEMVAELLGYENKERENLKKITPYKMFKDCSPEEQQKLLSEDAGYREIICKCEKITKADIVSALNRPLLVRSVDAVKRRTNAGMGRCQGGFCFTKVVKTISEERKIKYEEVLKENRGSEISVGALREVNNEN